MMKICTTHSPLSSHEGFQVHTKSACLYTIVSREVQPHGCLYTAQPRFHTKLIMFVPDLTVDEVWTRFVGNK